MAAGTSPPPPHQVAVGAAVASCIRICRDCRPYWTLVNRMDSNMPGGRFWYLPEHRDEDGKEPLYLPVAQVLDWLLDLLDTSLEKLADTLDPDHDGLRRNLYAWRNDRDPTLPTIGKYFHDDVKISFAAPFFPTRMPPLKSASKALCLS